MFFHPLKILHKANMKETFSSQRQGENKNPRETQARKLSAFFWTCSGRYLGWGKKGRRWSLGPPKVETIIGNTPHRAVTPKSYTLSVQLNKDTWPIERAAWTHAWLNTGTLRKEESYLPLRSYHHPQPTYNFFLPSGLPTHTHTHARTHTNLVENLT